MSSKEDIGASLSRRTHEVSRRGKHEREESLLRVGGENEEN